MTSEIKQDDAPREAPADNQPVIRVRDLVKTFDRRVLDGVNLDVRKGEMMVIMGGLLRQKHPAEAYDRIASARQRTR